MAAIVLVHGIDNQREGPDLITSAWLPALAGSVRLAGRDDLADQLLSPGQGPGAITTRTAYYGDLFRAPDRELDRQGVALESLDDLTPEQAELVEALALEWLGRLADHAPEGSADRVVARRTLDLAQNPAGAEAMGVRDGARYVARELIRTLAERSWLAHTGMFVAQRFVVTALTQVSRYLTEPGLRQTVQQTVLEQIGPDTRVLIGHSLGSVVAYECAHRLRGPLPLLITIGSPLGLRTLVTDRLDPPPRFPAWVGTWLNVANLYDCVAAEPDLAPLFAQSPPPGARFQGITFPEGGPDPHRPQTYLGRRPVGQALAAVWP